MAGRRRESNIRGQSVTPRRRRADGSRRRSRGITVAGVFGYIRRFARPISAALLLLGLVIGYSVLANSRLFELKRVEVLGAAESLRPEIEQMVTRAVNNDRLLGVDLKQIRQRVETIPRVRTAWVIRILPDALRVEVEERQRTVLVRRRSSGALVWLD